MHKKVSVGVAERHVDVTIASDGAPAGGEWIPAQVTTRTYLGSTSSLKLRVGDGEKLRSVVTGSLAVRLEDDSPVYVRVDAEDINVYSKGRLVAVGSQRVAEPSDAQPEAEMREEVAVENIDTYVPGDITVRDAAVEFLGITDVDAAFVYFGQVDVVGHHEGVGESYIQSIERVDELVGTVMAALDARDDRDDWIVVLTTDHGHIDAGGHGGRSAEECEIWAVSDGADLLAEIAGPGDIAGAIERAYA